MRAETVAYGSGEDAAELQVTVPVRICDSCNFEFTDAEADDIRHDAICHHLGVLKPSQVAGIRKQHGHSRGNWANLTGLGEASLARWENGHLIQNPANDRLLYLLMFPDNLQRLRERLESSDKRRRNVAPLGARASQVDGRFPFLADIETARKEATSFCLVSSSEGASCTS
jgi:DNA-binding transcriptional regulator YiaG